MSANTLVKTALIVLLVSTVGCIGVSSSGDAFLNAPANGMSEIEMIKTYGAPDYTLQSDGTTVHVYNIVDRAHYVLYGYDNSVEMVVICENGKVTETKNTKAGDAMQILWPADYIDAN